MDELGKNILDTVQVGALATTSPDGAPLATPLHFARMDDHIIWITDKNSKHAKNSANGNRVEFVVWDDQKRAVYLKTSVKEVKEDEIEAARKSYIGKLSDFLPKLPNPQFYKAPIGELDQDYPAGNWQHYIS